MVALGHRLPGHPRLVFDEPIDDLACFLGLPLRLLPIAARRAHCFLGLESPGAVLGRENRQTVRADVAEEVVVLVVVRDAGLQPRRRVLIRQLPCFRILRGRLVLGLLQLLQRFLQFQTGDRKFRLQRLERFLKPSMSPRNSSGAIV